MKRFILPFTFLIISCGTQTVMENHENGNIKNEIISLTDSTQMEKRYTSNGSLYAEIKLKDSIKNGISKIYDLASGLQYEFQFKNGRRNIKWRLKDKDGKYVKDNRDLGVEIPEQLKNGYPFYGTVELINSKSDSIKSYFCCDVDEYGFTYSNCGDLNSMPTGKCDTQIPIKNRTPIISFTAASIGKKEYGILIEEHLIDEFFIPFHTTLNYEITE